MDKSTNYQNMSVRRDRNMENQNDLQCRSNKNILNNKNKMKPNKPKKENPFGSAKPREEVLAQKGIDFHVIDDRIQRKSSVAHFSRTQEIQLQKIQDDLKMAEDMWRDANEKELPEEEFKLLVERKRRALNDLMNKFKAENEGKDIEDERSMFERPSDRRRRRNDQHHHIGGYASFHRKDRWYGSGYDANR